jgi:hypothetical protein
VAEPPNGERRRPCRNCCVPANPKMPQKSERSANSPAAVMLLATGSSASASSLSWQGPHTTTIVEELSCHPKTVRKRLHRFNAESIDGLGDRPGVGRKPRITEDQRSRIIALVSKEPPGMLVRYDGLPPGGPRRDQGRLWDPDRSGRGRPGDGHRGRPQSSEAHPALGEGVRWRDTRPWAQSVDLEVVPKGRESSGSTLTRHPTPPWSAWTNSDR